MSIHGMGNNRVSRGILPQQAQQKGLSSGAVMLYKLEGARTPARGAAGQPWGSSACASPTILF